MYYLLFGRFSYLFLSFISSDCEFIRFKTIEIENELNESTYTNLFVCSIYSTMMSHTIKRELNEFNLN